MTPREIDRDDVRTGDLIRWQQGETAVIARAIVKGHEVRLPLTDAGDSVVIGIGVPRGIVTLLDRPQPPIPTNAGTVIREKHTGMVYIRSGGWWCYGDNNTGWGELELSREDFDVLVPEVIA